MSFLELLSFSSIIFCVKEINQRHKKLGKDSNFVTCRKMIKTDLIPEVIRYLKL